MSRHAIGRLPRVQQVADQQDMLKERKAITCNYETILSLLSQQV